MFKGQKQYLLRTISLVTFAYYISPQMENATYEQSTEVCHFVFSDVQNGVKSPKFVGVKNLQ
jgi:hypothetical protein